MITHSTLIIHSLIRFHNCAFSKLQEIFVSNKTQTYTLRTPKYASLRKKVLIHRLILSKSINPPINTFESINPPINTLESINQKINTFVAIERWPKVLIVRLILSESIKLPNNTFVQLALIKEVQT